MPPGCHNCRKRRSATVCAKCRRADFDDIRIRREPHPEAERAALLLDAAPSRRVTNLPPGAEDALRELLSNLFALDPVDALLLLHIANGGSCAAFGEYAARVARAISRYSIMSRATAHARWNSIKARFAPFAALAPRGRRRSVK